MLFFAVKVRNHLVEPLLLNDAEVARLLGCARSSVWAWLDAGQFPEPKRVGKFRLADGRQRSGRTFWYRADIQLFARCRDMAEYRKLKAGQEK